MVRSAEIKDIPAIIGLFREQVPETHLAFAEKGFSARKSANLVRSSITQGFAWVYDNEGVTGVLVAQKNLNMFSDTVIEANLLAIFVKPEQRNGISAGRLLKTFISKCDEDKVQMVWIGTNVNSPLGDKVMNRLGFRLQEQFYLKER